MLTELDSAIAAEEPIVVTLWQPHWAYAKYELKNLADPERPWATPRPSTRWRAWASARSSRTWRALWTFAMDDEQLAGLENTVFTDNDGDVQAGVTAWLKDNEFSDLIA